jgi:hypothetical protein
VRRGPSVLRVEVPGGGGVEAGKIRFGVVDVTTERNNIRPVRPERRPTKPWKRIENRQSTKVVRCSAVRNRSRAS